MIELTKKQGVSYKRRWQKVKSKQIEELQTMPMSLKFKQLCLLMDSFPAMQEDKNRDDEVSAIRQRWITLKRRCKK